MTWRLGQFAIPLKRASVFNEIKQLLRSLRSVVRERAPWCWSLVRFPLVMHRTVRGRG